MNFHLELPPFGPHGREMTVFFDNILTNDDFDCLLSRDEWANMRESEVSTSTNSNSGIVDKEIRVSMTSFMKYDSHNAILWAKLLDMVWMANRQYFQFDLSGIYEPAQLSVYTAEDCSYFDWHVDFSFDNPCIPRKLSVSMLLNDPSEFEGGDFQVKLGGDAAINLEQARGRSWIFPSWIMHRVTPVTKGIRKSLVIWVNGPGFK